MKRTWWREFARSLVDINCQQYGHYLKEFTVADRGQSLSSFWKVLGPVPLALLIGAAIRRRQKQGSSEVTKPRTPPIVWIILALMVAGAVVNIALKSTLTVQNTARTAAATTDGSHPASLSVASAQTWTPTDSDFNSAKAAAPAGQEVVSNTQASKTTDDTAEQFSPATQSIWILETFYYKKPPSADLTFTTQAACEHMIAALSDPTFRSSSGVSGPVTIGYKCVEAPVQSR